LRLSLSHLPCYSWNAFFIRPISQGEDSESRLNPLCWCLTKQIGKSHQYRDRFNIKSEESNNLTWEGSYFLLLNLDDGEDLYHITFNKYCNGNTCRRLKRFETKGKCSNTHFSPFPFKCSTNRLLSPFKIIVLDR